LAMASSRMSSRLRSESTSVNRASMMPISSRCLSSGACMRLERALERHDERRAGCLHTSRRKHHEITSR
jgi:hypothetical protein